MYLCKDKHSYIFQLLLFSLVQNQLFINFLIVIRSSRKQFLNSILTSAHFNTK